ncbi:MAG: hypothetical protein WCH40_08290 [Verrucomicrobiales bacterium]
MFVFANLILPDDETHSRPEFHAGTADLTVFKIGSQEQAMFARSGDDLRIDWGYLYVSAPKVATEASGFNDDYTALKLTPQSRAVLKPGRNVIAFHCHQGSGVQYVDLGTAGVISARRK